MKIKLIVFLSDGRELSGTYDFLGVLARLDFARKLPLYDGFELLDAV